MEVSGSRALGQTISGCGRNYPPDPHGHSKILGGHHSQSPVLCHHVRMLHLGPVCVLPWNESSSASLQGHFVVGRRTARTAPTVSLAEARPLVGDAKGSRKHALGLSHIWDRARISGPESSPGSFHTEWTDTGASHLSSRLPECSQVRS